MGAKAFHRVWKNIPRRVRTKALENAMYPALRARALSSTAQYLGFDFLAGFVPGTQRVERKRDWRLLKEFDQMSRQLLTEDAGLFIREILPMAALWTTPPYFSVTELVDFLRDGLNVYRRRQQRKSDLPYATDSFPDYYQRTFHFQTDGYFTKESAARYDRQVDLLFGGTADAMRRLWIRPLLALPEFAQAHVNGGRNLRILETGCGAGSATASLLGLFPECNYYGVDLSAAYLDFARDRYSPALLDALGRRTPKELHWIPANAEKLPKDLVSMDVVLNVFMFHELPLKARRNVLASAYRALRPDGYFVFIDSAQMGDSRAVDQVLPTFPQNYHEPFFTNYIKRPMERLLEDAGFSVVANGTGLVSKFIIAQKNG